MTGRRELWEVARFFGPASRVPAAVRLLPHRRPSGGPSAARAAGHRPGRRADRRVRLGDRRLGRPRAAASQIEIEYGLFERRIELAEEADADAVTVTYEAGILRLEVPLS